MLLSGNSFSWPYLTSMWHSMWRQLTTTWSAMGPTPSLAPSSFSPYCGTTMDHQQQQQHHHNQLLHLTNSLTSNHYHHPASADANGIIAQATDTMLSSANNGNDDLSQVCIDVKWTIISNWTVAVLFQTIFSEGRWKRKITRENCSVLLSTLASAFNKNGLINFCKMLFCNIYENWKV